MMPQAPTIRNEGVAKKVRMAARELGYQPNIAARALRSSRSNIIGIISEGPPADCHC